MFFSGRAQLEIPPETLVTLSEIPLEFTDDGLTLFPDTWFGFDFKWAGRMHDWRYCTRCHSAGTMNVTHKKYADREIQRNVNKSLPWRWRLLGAVVRLGVWRGGYGSYNSCGKSLGLKCRHGMMMPDWMGP